LTSYFEPEIVGDLHRTDAFSAPLLKRPRDLIEIATSRFDERLADVGSLRGRLWNDPQRGRPVLVPYYSRAEIQNGALKGKDLELCWVDPIDAFVLQIQGSGTIFLPGDRRLRVGYADQNGHPYHAIGKFLTEAIPLEKMSLFSIESHLKALPIPDAHAVMNKNPSYVFFDTLDGSPKTSLGNSVFPGRTIATDSRYFPKGALAFLQFKKPVFESPEATEPNRWESVSRFVFDQDTGGAIRGGGRADLFWGSGVEAKRYAGYIKDPATLFYLVPKPATLQKIAEERIRAAAVP
jgi:membrane-bound lytic murein transglycosylase A